MTGLALEDQTFVGLPEWKHGKVFFSSTTRGHHNKGLFGLDFVINGDVKVIFLT